MKEIPQNETDRLLRQQRLEPPHVLGLLLEDTCGLSQGVPLTDELLASIAISIKRLADMFDDWRRK